MSSRVSSGFRVWAMATACAFLGGCTTNPFTGEQQVSKTAAGAAIGAGVGAVVGVLTGDNGRERRKRALIGAGIGALAGGSVGAYMDYQEKKLRERLQGTGVSVTRDGDNLILNMPGDVTFDTDSSEIKVGFHDVLDSVGLVLKEYDKTVIEVAGHTDSTGGDDYNQALSERRASSVGSYLVGQGIDARRVLALGFGERSPATSNATAAGRALNRRVVLTLVPLVQS